MNNWFKSRTNRSCNCARQSHNQRRFRVRRGALRRSGRTAMSDSSTVRALASRSLAQYLVRIVVGTCGGTPLARGSCQSHPGRHARRWITDRRCSRTKRDRKADLGSGCSPKGPWQRCTNPGRRLGMRSLPDPGMRVANCCRIYRNCRLSTTTSPGASYPPSAPQLPVRRTTVCNERRQAGRDSR